MGLFDNIFRPSPNKSSAALAKERLQIIVAHERGSRRGSPDYLPALKKELLGPALPPFDNARAGLGVLPPKGDVRCRLRRRG